MPSPPQRRSAWWRRPQPDWLAIDGARACLLQDQASSLPTRPAARAPSRRRTACHVGGRSAGCWCWSWFEPLARVTSW